MTVRTNNAWVFVPGADQCGEHKGVKWGLKVSDLDGWQFVALAIFDGQQWNVFATAGREFARDVQAHGGDVRKWVREVVVPAMNTGFLRVFKPAAVEPDAFTSLAEELDHILVNELRVTVNPDGTLTATLP